MKETLEILEEECSRLTLEHKNSEDIGTITAALLLLGGAELIAIIALYIRVGFSYTLLVFLVILLMMFLYYKLTLSAADSKVESVTVSIDDLSKVDRVVSKLQYLDAGINMKASRIKSTKYFYIIIFPIFALTIQEILDGLIGASYTHWQVPFLFVASWITWTLYYRRDKSSLAAISNRVRYMLNKAQLIAKS